MSYNDLRASFGPIFLTSGDGRGGKHRPFLVYTCTRILHNRNLVPRVFVPYCACWLDETRPLVKGNEDAGYGGVTTVYFKPYTFAWQQSMRNALVPGPARENFPACFHLPFHLHFNYMKFSSFLTQRLSLCSTNVDKVQVSSILKEKRNFIITSRIRSPSDRSAVYSWVYCPHH